MQDSNYLIDNMISPIFNSEMNNSKHCDYEDQYFEACKK